MFPSSPSHSGSGTKRKRQGVGFSSTSRDPLGLPSIPPLPPDSQHAGPAVHIDVDPNAPSSRRYPSASELHGKTMRLNPVLFASAKWFSVIGACAFDDIAHTYADGAGMLPGQIPLQAIRSYDWLARIAIPPSILCHTRPCGRPVLSTRFMTAVCDRLELLLTQDLVPSIIPAGGQGQSSIFNKLTGPSRWPETHKLYCYARYFRRGQFRRFLPPVCLFPTKFRRVWPPGWKSLFSSTSASGPPP